MNESLITNIPSVRLIYTFLCHKKFAYLITHNLAVVLLVICGWCLYICMYLKMPNRYFFWYQYIFYSSRSLSLLGE